MPEKEGGSSDISNAVPLCQNCHEQFGDNKYKRKEIIQMRDWWYETCERTFSNPGPLSLEILGNIDNKLEKIQSGQQDVSELKNILMGLTYMNIDSMTSASATIVASGIVNTISANQLTSTFRIQRVCNNCGYNVTENNIQSCPKCSGEINVQFQFH